MGQNEKLLLTVFKQLNQSIENDQFVISKNGSKTVEILNCVIDGLNPRQPLLDLGFKHTNEDYCRKELSWYLEEDLNVYPMMEDIKIWRDISDKDGFINSNYGWCVFNKDNNHQFEHCVNQLKDDASTRKAVMIYTRPTIQNEWNKNGKQDFICTFAVQYFIRNNELHSTVIMRSNDAVFGFFNDFYWQCFVQERLFSQLLEVYPLLHMGKMTWFASSFHAYERHFALINQICFNK